MTRTAIWIAAAHLSLLIAPSLATATKPAAPAANELKGGRRLGTVYLQWAKDELVNNEVVDKGANVPRNGTVKAPPYEIEMSSGVVLRVTAKAGDLVPVRIGGATLTAKSNLTAWLDAIGGCKNISVRGATKYQCTGAKVIVPGPTHAPEAIVLIVEPKDAACRKGHKKVASAAKCPQDDVDCYPTRAGEWCWGATTHHERR